MNRKLYCSRYEVEIITGALHMAHFTVREVNRAVLRVVVLCSYYSKITSSVRHIRRMLQLVRSTLVMVTLYLKNTSAPHMVHVAV